MEISHSRSQRTLAIVCVIGCLLGLAAWLSDRDEQTPMSVPVVLLRLLVGPVYLPHHTVNRLGPEVA